LFLNDFYINIKVGISLALLIMRNKFIYNLMMLFAVTL
jgi:hypothetical protein